MKVMIPIQKVHPSRAIPRERLCRWKAENVSIIVRHCQKPSIEIDSIPELLSFCLILSRIFG